MLYHCTSNPITEIDEYGRFGEFLFFGSSPSHMGEVTYQLEIDTDENKGLIIDCGRFFYREDCSKLDDIVSEVMNLADCDEDQAQEYLSQRDHVSDAELDWDIQGLTAKAAKILGFRGVAVPDEYGTSYMIDMLGLESELNLL